MISFFRRHHKKILVVLVILIVPAFVVWGGSCQRVDQGAGDQSVAFEPVARVNGVPIPAGLVAQQISAQVSQMQRLDPDASRASLSEEQIEGILDSLVSNTLLEEELAQTHLPVEEELLTEILRKDPIFQDPDGNFDPELWNEWVRKRRGENWKAFYAEIRGGLKRELLVAEVAAAARVLESDVRRRFEEDHTELEVRYVALAPEVEPTEEQILEEYNENPENYQNPEQIKARFVAFSLKGGRPPLVDEIMTQLRSGADFAELAEAHSDSPSSETGGDMGWRTERAGVDDYLAPMFSTPVGSFSEPVEGPLGWYIYYVEDERTDEATGQREVHVRQILVDSKLKGEALDARKEEAEAFAQAAQEAGGIEAAAQETGIEVVATDFFTRRTSRIEGVPARDAYSFRTAADQLAMDEVSGVIEGAVNLYVAQLFEVKPATLKPLDEVRGEVEEAVERKIKRSPEYRDRMEALKKEVEERAHSLQDIVAMFPDMELKIEQAPPFSVKNYRFGRRPFWLPREVFEAVGYGQPGAFGGPIEHPAGTEIYYVELVSKTPPEQDESLETAWEEEKDQVRRVLEGEARQARLGDYFLAKRMRSAVAVDEERLNEILGREVPAEEAKEAAESVEAEPADDAPAGAEADEEAAPETAEAATASAPAAAESAAE